MYEPFACTTSVICPPSQLSTPSVHPTGGTAHLLPRGDLVVVPDPRRVSLAAGLRGDVRGFSDEEGPRHARALLIERDAEAGVYVCHVGAVSGLGREDDAVGEGHIADFDGLEERGRGSRRHAVGVRYVRMLCYLGKVMSRGAES